LGLENRKKTSQIGNCAALDYTVKNANRIPGLPWNIPCLILEKPTAERGKFCALTQKGFFLSPSQEKCSAPCKGTFFRDVEWYQAPEVRSRKSGGRFRAGNSNKSRANPPPPQEESNQSPFWLELLQRKCALLSN
jgi:hypothetical protein